MLEQSKLRVFVGDHRVAVEWYTNTVENVVLNIRHFRNWSTAEVFARHTTAVADLGIVYLRTQVADSVDAENHATWLTVGNVAEMDRTGTVVFKGGAV